MKNLKSSDSDQHVTQKLLTLKGLINYNIYIIINIKLCY